MQPAVRIDLDNPRGAIRDFIAQEPVQREIAAQFKNMLRNYTDESGDLIYRDRLRDMCTSNSPWSLLRYAIRSCLDRQMSYSLQTSSQNPLHLRTAKLSSAGFLSQLYGEGNLLGISIRVN